MSRQVGIQFIIRQNFQSNQVRLTFATVGLLGIRACFLLETHLSLRGLERGGTEMPTLKPRGVTNTLHSLLLVCLANKMLPPRLGIFRE